MIASEAPPSGGPRRGRMAKDIYKSAAGGVAKGAGGFWLDIALGAFIGAFAISALFYAGVIKAGAPAASAGQYGACEAVVAVLKNGTAFVVIGWYMSPQAASAGRFLDPVFAAVNQTAVRNGTAYALFSEKLGSIALFIPGAGVVVPMLTAAYVWNGTWPPGGGGYPMVMYPYYPPFNNASIEGAYAVISPGGARLRLNATYGGLLAVSPAAEPGLSMEVPCAVHVAGPLTREAALGLPLPPAAVWYYEALGYYKYGLSEAYLEETAWRIPLGWPLAQSLR